jgi:chromatin segregation and condensation protein Rec8/ScpA/Scc1 (kleisin family)
MEAVQTFILLLFLAQDGRVSLWQNEETEELYIAVGSLNLAGTQQPVE